jgi:23S rRNA (cytidine1920-2'-O)/16S rRNA (cytidine1409-2'-O)-methyltransferase
VADKPARLCGPDQPIEVIGPPPPFVSRGGEKLAGALDRFGVDPAGRAAIDIGASTGGFTDCLLQRGAVEVTAVDVGRGQLHDRLRRDPRVTVLERVNIRTAPEETFAGRRFDVVVVDLSFISLRTVAPALLRRAAPGADLVVLIKPQFEAGRQEVSRGRGVIRDPEVWRRCLHDVSEALGAAGAAMMGVMVSPLRGADGNVEFLVHLRPPPAGGSVGPRISTGEAIDAAVAAGIQLAADRAG